MMLAAHHALPASEQVQEQDIRVSRGGHWLVTALTFA